MTEETNEPAADTASDLPAAQMETANTTPQAEVVATRDQLRNLADAIIADVKRAAEKAGKALKGGDLATLEKVAASATKLAIDTKVAADGDTKAQQALVRRKKNLDAQLANIRAYATEAATNKFWSIVDATIDRFFAALLKAI